MSAGLNLLQRKLSRDNFHVVDSDFCLDKASVQEALVSHYGDDTIKVNNKCKSFGSCDTICCGTDINKHCKAKDKKKLVLKLI